MADPAPDPVGTAVGAIGGGAGAGAAVITAALAVLRPVLVASPIWLLPAMLFAGIVVAGVSGWLLGLGIADTWRRGITAALAVVAALMLAGLAAPVDAFVGRIGLGGYAVALAALGTVGVRAARRAATR